MKIRFIINPISGTGKQKGIEEYIAKYIENFEIIYTQKQEKNSMIFSVKKFFHVMEQLN